MKRNRAKITTVHIAKTKTGQNKPVLYMVARKGKLLQFAFL